MKFFPIVVVFLIYLGVLFYGYPQVLASLQAREKVCKDETTKLEQTKTTDESLGKLQVTLAKQTAPYAKYDEDITADTQQYAKPEDAQKIIISEASNAGLKIGPSKLSGVSTPVSTLEGDVKAREFIISVEGNHQEIGSWLAKSEALVKTCRPQDSQWYPLSTTVVGAKIQFYLLDDAMTLAKPKSK